MKNALILFKKITSLSFILLMIFAGKKGCECGNESHVSSQGNPSGGQSGASGSAHPSNHGAKTGHNQKKTSGLESSSKNQSSPSPQEKTTGQNLNTLQQNPSQGNPSGGQSSVSNSAHPSNHGTKTDHNQEKIPDLKSSSENQFSPPPQKETTDQNLTSQPTIAKSKEIKKKDKTFLLSVSTTQIAQEKLNLLFEIPPEVSDILTNWVEYIDSKNNADEAILKFPSELSDNENVELLIKIMLNDMAKVISLSMGVQKIEKDKNKIKDFDLMQNPIIENDQNYRYYVAIMKGMNTLQNQPHQFIMKNYESCEKNLKESLLKDVTNIINVINGGNKVKIQSLMEELITNIKKLIVKENFPDILQATENVKAIVEVLAKLSEIRKKNSINNKIITFDDIKVIEYTIKANYTIPGLSLSGCQINNEELEYLAEALKFNHSLDFLNLSNNQISDKGVKYLAEALKFNHSLTRLNLNDNRISDKGVSDLAEALKFNRSLLYLNLYDNRISENRKEALRKNTETELQFLID